VQLGILVKLGIDVAGLDLFAVDTGDLGVRDTVLVPGEPDDRLVLPQRGVVERLLVPSKGTTVLGTSIVITFLGGRSESQLGGRSGASNERRRGVDDRLVRVTSVAVDVESGGQDQGDDLEGREAESVDGILQVGRAALTMITPPARPDLARLPSGPLLKKKRPAKQISSM